MAYDGSDPGQNNYVENSQIFPGDCYGQDQKGIKNGAIFPTKSCMVMWPPSMLDKQLHSSSATQSFFGNLNINVYNNSPATYRFSSLHLLTNQSGVFT